MSVVGGRTVAELLEKLTLDEKAALLAGADMWSTVAVPRVGLPAVKMTDGPNGARGPTLSTTAGGRTLCVPCGTALAATWDPALLQRVGAALGHEARAKGVRMLLAPTVNLHRSPLAGRNFECYSEDPLLSAAMAVGYVRGVQSQGVAAVVKHFVANEAETARTLLDSVVDERSLRELYLVPFEAAVRDAGALAVMTGYNRLNGEWCAESAGLLEGILRTEWDFEGLVMTDWFAVGSTVASLRAGLDLQMPGPARFYGPVVADAVRSGTVEESLVDAAAGRLLHVFGRLAAPDETPPAPPEDGPALAREAATAGMVLLHNHGLLPLSGVGSIAVLGPNAHRAQIMGGGSSAVFPQHRTTPLAALREKLAGTGIDLRHEPGCLIDKRTPALDSAQLTTPTGAPGLALSFYEGTGPGAFAGPPRAHAVSDTSRLLYMDPPADGLPAGGWSLRAVGVVHAAVSGDYTLSLSHVGNARVLIDGELVLDGGTSAGGGDDFFGLAGPELTARVPLEAGARVELTIEFCTGAMPIHAVHVGLAAPMHHDLIGQAVAAAAASDVAVVVVGTTDEWESEGFDRTHLALPGEQDELIRRVCAANPRTVVVLNCGAPVSMPWHGEPAAILLTWFGGQEMATALADVLFGDGEPGGRLPCTLPERLEHTPSFGAFPGEDSRVIYGEGLLVGYRWYDTRRLPVLFPFGHGLSYASFELGALRLSAQTFGPDQTLAVTVPVRNTATRRGTEVVQLYVEPPADIPAFRPRRELKAFAKVTLEPGEASDVVLTLDARAFSRWDPGNPEHDALAQRISAAGAFTAAGQTTPPGWRIDPGEYRLHAGRSIADIAQTATVGVDPAEA